MSYNPEGSRYRPERTSMPTYRQRTSDDDVRRAYAEWEHANKSITARTADALRKVRVALANAVGYGKRSGSSESKQVKQTDFEKARDALERKRREEQAYYGISNADRFAAK